MNIIKLTTLYIIDEIILRRGRGCGFVYCDADVKERLLNYCWLFTALNSDDALFGRRLGVLSP